MMSMLFNFQRQMLRKVKYQITTWLGRSQAYFTGIQLERGVCFYGIPFLQKARKASASIGSHCTFRSQSTSNLIGINRPCIISVHQLGNLRIGKNCGFSGTVIGCFKEIIIDDDVRCGANTLITDSDWHLDDPRSGLPKAIHIHRNVWLGVGSMILKGVTIGENSIIGAGSVVTKSILPNVVAGGNPCKIIKNLR